MGINITAIDNLEGSNKVNSLSNQEKTDLRNINIKDLTTAQKKSLYYKEVKIGGGKTRQLGSIIECMKLKDGVAVDSWRGTETPISWKSEAGALIQVYLIAHNKMDAGLRNREIDGMIGPKTFKFLKSHVNEQEVQRQRGAERGRELREISPKTRFAYDYLRKNIFGKDKGTAGFPLGNHYDQKVDQGRLTRYMSVFNHKFCIDKESKIDQAKGKLYLELDDFAGNEKYNSWKYNPDLIVDGAQFVEGHDNKYKFNEKKFWNKIKDIVVKICNNKQKWPEL